jgi:hypothetical protein
MLVISPRVIIFGWLKRLKREPMKINLIKLSALFILCLPVLIQSVCNHDDHPEPLPNADQYVTWSFNGNTGNLTSASDSLTLYSSGNFHALYAMTKPTPSTSFSLYWTGNSQAGTYLVSDYMLLINGRYFVSTPRPCS